MTRHFDYQDEGSHEPATGDADWQESVFVHWYDLRRRPTLCPITPPARFSNRTPEAVLG
jgi:hypothetical protein